MSQSTPSVQTRVKSPVRLARERLGISQAQLAARTGVDRKTVRRWDYGTHRPGSIEVAQRVAEVLQEPLEELFPPDAHLNVRHARANDHAQMPPRFDVPDPAEVLATIRSARRPRRLVAPLAVLLGLVVLATAATLLVTGTGHSHSPGSGPSTPATSSAREELPHVPVALGTANRTRPKQSGPGRHRATKHHGRKHHSSGSSSTSTTLVTDEAQPTSTTDSSGSQASGTPRQTTSSPPAQSAGAGQGCNDFAVLC